MTPAMLDRVLDGKFADAVLSRQGVERCRRWMSCFAGTVLRANLPYLLLCQRAISILASGLRFRVEGSPTLGPAVTDVVFLRSWKQMIQAHTMTNVAAMQRLFSFSKRANQQLEYHTMRRVVSSVVPELAVSVTVEKSCPQPAGFSSVDPRPESRQWIGLRTRLSWINSGRHVENIPQVLK